MITGSLSANRILYKKKRWIYNNSFSIEISSGNWMIFMPVSMIRQSAMTVRGADRKPPPLTALPITALPGWMPRHYKSLLSVLNALTAVWPSWQLMPFLTTAPGMIMMRRRHWSRRFVNWRRTARHRRFFLRWNGTRCRKRSARHCLPQPNSGPRGMDLAV